MYQSIGFLEKNSDSMTVNMEELIGKSTMSYISKLHSWSAAGGDDAKKEAAGGKTGFTGKKATSGHVKKKKCFGNVYNTIKILNGNHWSYYTFLRKMH